jgi:hypothetical protein
MHVEVLAIDKDDDGNVVELGDCPVPLKQAVGATLTTHDITHRHGRRYQVSRAATLAI